jgi:hypothetical protein
MAPISSVEGGDGTTRSRRQGNITIYVIGEMKLTFFKYIKSALRGMFHFEERSLTKKHIRNKKSWLAETSADELSGGQHDSVLIYFCIRRRASLQGLNSYSGLVFRQHL